MDCFPQKKILCIGGSPRKGGNTDFVLKTLAQAFENDLEVEAQTANLRDYDFEPCIGCERCRKDKSCTGLKDDMQLLYPKIMESQGLLLVSPTHNYNITAWMKAFIDRTYCFYNFENDAPRSWTSNLSEQDRKGAVVGICEQSDPKDMGFTLGAMRIPMEVLGYEVLEELPIFEVFRRGAIGEHPENSKSIFKLAERVASSLN